LVWCGAADTAMTRGAHWGALGLMAKAATKHEKPAPVVASVLLLFFRL
jgi:hypothetical protein